MQNEMQQRQTRVIARGEHSNHSHVVCGDATVTEDKGNIIVTVGNAGAVLKHILEKEWIETGTEIWTKEHLDIPLSEGVYTYVPQIEYNPYDDTVRQVKD